MAKSKLVKINQRIADAVTGGYRKIESGVVGDYQRIEDGVTGAFRKVEDGFVDRFLTRDGETVEQAHARLQSENEAHRAAKDKTRR